MSEVGFLGVPSVPWTSICPWISVVLGGGFGFAWAWEQARTTSCKCVKCVIITAIPAALFTAISFPLLYFLWPAALFVMSAFAAILPMGFLIHTYLEWEPENHISEERLTDE